jgi:PKD repeat protein
VSRENLTKAVRVGSVLAVFIIVSLALNSVAVADSWETETTPTGENLYDVEKTTDGAFAVGAGGDFIKRTNTGWTEITDTGPSGNSNDLLGAGVTDDGDEIWFVGTSGAVGEYNVNTGNLNDFTNPGELSTNNFNDVAVKGNSGSASVYIAGDDGNVYYSRDDGENWNVVTPASGAAINSIDFYGEQSGHLVDGNKKVYETTDGATSWTDIGITGAGNSLLDVDSNSANDVRVSTSNGNVYSYDGTSWTNTPVSMQELRGIGVESGEGRVVGGGGTVFEVSSGSFTQDTTPTTNLLRAVALGSPDVAVGNSGTAIVSTGDGSGDNGDGGDGNTPPTADLSVSSTSVSVGETVTFDASDSSDSDGSVVSYGWDFDGDGTVDTSTMTPTVDHTYSSAGTYDAGLTVTDDDGATDTATQTVTVSSGGDGETSPVEGVSDALWVAVTGQDGEDGLSLADLGDAIQTYQANPSGATIDGEPIDLDALGDLIQYYQNEVA